jgi:uncharacterized membrane protein YcjF (UPF0283 family)
VVALPWKSRKLAAPEQPEVAKSPDRWEIARQWKTAWRGIKLAALGALVLAALLVVGQVYLFYDLFAAMHPAAGVGFLALVTLALIAFVGVPIVRMARLPAAVRPPAIDLAADELTVRDLHRRKRFDDAYLRALARNPLLTERRTEIEAARVGLAAVPAERAALSAFEHDRIEPLLAPLDRLVEQEVHAEATAVGVATAVSMSGAVDAAIVLWRNVNMVSRVARIYYGRPSLRASALVVRDVASAVILSRALDDVSDMAGNALGKVSTHIGGMLVGPVMDGSVNALVTLKLGYLAKSRCRSFTAWTSQRKANALAEVFGQIKAESLSVTRELVKTLEGMGGAVGGAFAWAGAKATAAPRSAWSQVRRLIARPRTRPSDLPGGA